MKVLYLLLFILFYGGLKAQEIECFVIEPPAQILPGIQKIAVMDFSGSYGRELSDYLISALLESQRGITEIKGGFFSSSKEGKTYLDGARTDIYTIVERSRLNAVLSEQNLSTSGIVDESQAANLGKVLGVDAIIIGTVNPNSKDSKTREAYKVKQNGQWVDIYEDCITRNVSAEARMRIINVNTGQIIGTSEAGYVVEDKQCGDNIPKLISTEDMTKQAVQACVYQKFVNYFAPTFSLKEFEVFDIDLDEYEDLSDKAIEFVDNGDLDKAYVIYYGIVKEDPYNDVAQYNLGVLNEVVGNYQSALEFYQAAYNIDDDDDYSDAIKSVTRAIEFNTALATLGINIQPHNYSVSEEQIKSATSEKIRLTGDKSDRIDLKTEPTSASETVVKVPGGIELEMIEQTGSWYKVKTFDGKIGYVNEDDLD